MPFLLIYGMDVTWVHLVCNIGRLIRFKPVSTVFAMLTFGVLLLVFRAGETFFCTGWFVESLVTQILKLFRCAPAVICLQANCIPVEQRWRSKRQR